MASKPSVLKSYVQLLRAHHWIKNVLIFVPLFFTRDTFNTPFITAAVLGFFCFSLLASIVYIFNDIRDIEKDRLHVVKCSRPLASGKIPVRNAIIVIVILSFILIALLIVSKIYGTNLWGLKTGGLLLLYFLLNIGYSLGLKNIPIVDITILASGYLIRVLFGALLINVTVSVWLYFVITMGAYYVGLGKRRNELTGNEKAGNEKENRKTTSFYSHNFLDKNMYMFQSLCVVFYALWSIDSVTVERFHGYMFVYTIPLILIILLKYSLNIEANTDGDPISILLSDKILLLLCVIYIILAFCIVHLSGLTYSPSTLSARLSVYQYLRPLHPA